jgi:hypothetical protein
MICSYCGKDNNPGEKFCFECGNLMQDNKTEELEKAMNQPEEVKCPFCDKMHPVDISHCPETGDILPKPKIEKTVRPKTQIIKAKLLLSDNNEILIDSQEQSISRASFEKSIPADELLLISRNHFKIFYDDKKYYIEDKDSKNGTIVNGVEISGKGKYELKNGAIIEIAKAVSATFKIVK